jgi:hypothetical protein
VSESARAAVETARAAITIQHAAFIPIRIEKLLCGTPYQDERKRRRVSWCDAPRRSENLWREQVFNGLATTNEAGLIALDEHLGGAQARIIV